MRSLRHQSHKLLGSVDKEIEEGKDNEEVPSRPRLKKRHRSSNIVEVSFKEWTQSTALLEVLDIATEAGKGSDNPKASSSLEGVVKLLKKGLVREPRFKRL